MYGVSESSVKAHFRVTLSVPTLAVATVPLLVFIMYRDLATYGSHVTTKTSLRGFKLLRENNNSEYN